MTTISLVKTAKTFSSLFHRHHKSPAHTKTCWFTSTTNLTSSTPSTLSLLTLLLGTLLANILETMKTTLNKPLAAVSSTGTVEGSAPQAPHATRHYASYFTIIIYKSLVISWAGCFAKNLTYLLCHFICIII